jgi:hypothetical protein
MKKQEFFEHIECDYFKKLGCDFGDFKEMVSVIMPVFGVLKVDYERKSENEKIIIFKDVDQAMFVLVEDGYEIKEEDMDMTSNIMKIILDKEDVIKIVEHGIKIFTPANKDTVLFLGSIIGKKLLNIDEGLS